MYKISVIIPVYNAEDSLEHAINSILNQNWRGDITNDIEIILIDDCSTDNSKIIMNNYSTNYSNIKIFSTENNTGSPSIPRNIGIENSNSDYLMFMDNDDEYSEDICQTLYDIIIKEKVDVATCDWYEIFDSESKKHEFYDCTDKKCFIFNSHEAISNSLLKHDWMIWKNIYKKSLITNNNILFQNKLCEDTFFLFDVYLHMQEMVYIKNLYGVTKYNNDTSLSSSLNCTNIINYLRYASEFDELIYSYYQSQNYEYRFDFFENFLHHNLTRIIYLPKTDIKPCLKELYKIEKNIEFDNSIVINTFYDLILKIINYFIIKNHLSMSLFLILISKLSIKLRSI